jgi:hypothetical protein
MRTPPRMNAAYAPRQPARVGVLARVLAKLKHYLIYSISYIFFRGLAEYFT